MLLATGRRSSRRQRIGEFALVCVPGIVALGLVLHSLSQRAGLYGVTQYDDGVYLASALRLVVGVVPYRDYALVQPPGIAVLLAPIAALSHLIGTRAGLGVARVQTALVTGINASLVSAILRKHSLPGAFFGGLCLAVFPPAYAADHTVLLEPYVVLFCLCGTLVAFCSGSLSTKPSALFFAGLLFALASSVKLFGLVALIAFLLVVLVKSPRLEGFGVAGAACGAAALCGPFLLLSPGGFFHEVIITQLDRVPDHAYRLTTRLATIDGLSETSAGRSFHGYVGNPLLVTAVLLAFVLGASLLPSLFAHGCSCEWFVLLAAAGSVAALLAAPVFYDHYAYVSAAFLSLVMGFSIARVSKAIASRLRSTRATRALFAGFVLAVACFSVVVSVREASYDDEAMSRAVDVGPAIAAVVPKGVCAESDAAILLLSADRFPLSSSCPVIVDPTGAWLSVENGDPPSLLGRKNQSLVEVWSAALQRARYVVFSSLEPFRVPWTGALLDRFHTEFTRVGPDDLALYKRRRTSNSKRLGAL